MNDADKGQIRVVEAFFAVLVIFSAFTVSANLTVTQNKTGRDDLASVGLQALMKLDSSGSLGTYVTERNWTGIREALNIVLPPSICFNLTVYDEQMRQMNDAAITNGAFSSQRIEFVEYVGASRSSVFHSYIIHLNLAVAE